MPEIEANGISINYRLEGEGEETVVLVNGLADAARERGYWKLIAKVFPSNEASIELLHRCGYRDVGMHLRHGQHHDGWRDVLLLEKSL